MRARLGRWRRALRRRLVRLDPRLRRDVRRAHPERFVRAAYQIMLRRDPDPGGLDNYVGHLERGTLTPDGVLDEMLTSMELRALPYRDPMRSLHLSRCDFVRMLPRAARILDLGGTDQDDPAGSLVSMGYPYRFEELVVVDLPHGDRHALYARGGSDAPVATERGPVRYAYHSMTDLDRYADGSFDLVFAGESIEHVTRDEARTVFAEVWRVLRPGGWFCLDTPNRAVTVLQTGPEQLTNPDHELEYTHPEMVGELEAAGFLVETAVGLGYAGCSVAHGVAPLPEVADRHGVYHDVERCYLLAYLCRKPGASA